MAGRGTKRRTGWEGLRAAAEEGRLVPCFGSGANTHVLRLALRSPSTPDEATYKLARAELGWSELLRETVRRIAPREIPRLLPLIGGHGAATLVWDHLAASLASDSAAAASAERRLQRQVQEVLESIYDADVRAATDPWWDGWLGRFDHAITFNFDPLAVRATEDDPSWREDIDVDWRRSPVALRGARGSTTVWTPHGHVSHPETILLGAHLYGRYIGVLQRAFERHMRELREGDGALETAPCTWLDLAMTRPLVFVGLSLGRDEWALWWTLVRRARRFARRPKERPPLFFVARREATPAFEGLVHNARLVGAELLVEDSHDALWAKLADALDAPMIAP